MRTLKPILLILFILINAINTKISSQNSSILLKKWKEAQLDKTKSTILPTFSYAGYHNGEKAIPTTFAQSKEFNVKDTPFNAKGDGITDDKASIQRAIDSAEVYVTKNKGKTAIIKFPPGTFVVNTNANRNNTIKISKSNIIIKGSGSGNNGTILYQRQYLSPSNPGIKNNGDRKPIADYSCPYLFEFEPSNFSYRGNFITNVTANAFKETFSVEVNNVNDYRLAIGNWILLKVENNTSSSLLTEQLFPYVKSDLYIRPDNTKNKMIEEGVTIAEYHKIIGKDGNKLIFNEPILKDVNIDYNWKIYTYNHIEEVGIEDLQYKGGFVWKHFHHKSSEQTKIDLKNNVTANIPFIDPEEITDYNFAGSSGWSGIQFKGVVNGWIKNVVFSQMSQAALFRFSTNCSAVSNKYKDNPGHNFITAASSTRCFIGMNEDNATGDATDPHANDNESKISGNGTWHGCGVSKTSIGSVLWRNNHPKDGRSGVEMHSSQPRFTLFDYCTGGLFFNMGGADTSVPNHLEKLVVWNFDGVAEDKTTATTNLWQPGLKYKTQIVKPILSGLKGLTMNSNQCEAIESAGKFVDEKSLYEAQIEFRLGYIPSWINLLKSSGVNIPVTGLTISSASNNITIDETIVLNPNVLPLNATARKVNWVSSKPNVVTVTKNTGRITGIANGTATITATTEDGNFVDTYIITVGTPVPTSVENISLKFTKLLMQINETTTITPTITPSEASNKQINWTSSDNNIVSVVDGVITSHSTGIVTITATTVDGNFTAETLVKVDNAISNQALYKPVTVSDEQNDSNGVNLGTHAIDDNTVSRWAAYSFPQNLDVDLGQLKSISKIQLVTFKDRAYQFEIWAKEKSSDTYELLLDAKSNNVQGKVSAPISEHVNNINAQFVRIVVTGVSLGETSTWVNLKEFRIFASDETNLSSETIANNLITSATYPNPFKGKLTLIFQESNTSKEVQIINMLGKIIFSRNNISTDEITLEPPYNQVPKGIYSLRVHNNNRIKTIKIIRN
ncbi:DUF4955 domain-containing protein [Bacteroidota bacterium]